MGSFECIGHFTPEQLQVNLCEQERLQVSDAQQIALLQAKIAGRQEYIDALKHRIQQKSATTEE